MHQNSVTNCEAFIEGLIVHRPENCVLRIADVGSMDINGCYRRLFPERWEYVGFDIRSGKNVDVVLPVNDDGRWDLPDEYREAFDVVISGQCMEHVAAPWLWIRDVSSLCKPGGIVWLSVPNTEVFHEHPIDAWRVWPDGMRAVFREAGLTELACRISGPDTVGIARKPCNAT